MDADCTSSSFRSLATPTTVFMQTRARNSSFYCPTVGGVEIVKLTSACVASRSQKGGIVSRIEGGSVNHTVLSSSTPAKLAS